MDVKVQSITVTRPTEARKALLELRSPCPLGVDILLLRTSYVVGLVIVDQPLITSVASIAFMLDVIRRTDGQTAGVPGT